MLQPCKMRSIIYLIVKMVILANFTITWGQEVPVPGRNYLIQSKMDGGYINPQGNGGCERLGWIEFSYRVPIPEPEEFKWRVTIVDGEEDTYTIWTQSQSPSDIMNELTYENITENCGLVERHVRLIPHPALDQYFIEDEHSGKRLYSYGSEVGIVVWRDDPYPQYWAFYSV